MSAWSLGDVGTKHNDWTNAKQIGSESRLAIETFFFFLLSCSRNGVLPELHVSFQGNLWLCLAVEDPNNVHTCH